MSKRDLIVNYTPGEECRVAVFNNGKLDEFYSERTDNVSHVGNIYVGRVTNIEPAISAAFVDFGLEANGFLHVSDLHPRYFPGEGKYTKERVGKKTPRRERPAINEALRKGQEVIVQVLKEGVGSKGPTLTSYLSIPGRYLVMMPGMDRTGVSRKVEDEGQRAKMKAILDQLDLPDEFGFILRTAGFDRTKAELKRDLAYLLRLEKEMEKRRKAGGKPRLLYSEGDLLIRALRDMLTTDTERVIIDNADAVGRAARFMKIVSPRTVTKLFHYKGHTPVFHAMGVHEQLQSVYSREVPLPSGGRLVIDETEALVAIDVNSGKSRSAGDSEDNAFRTNMEAAEEICRQLRLRDLGGIVINDLIDMRQARHRKDVEARFEEILSSDRAKSTICPISEFGILEMTRQRMRGSHESLHFVSCPTCHGRGLVQKPESVSADAIRDTAALLDNPKVRRVELVVHPRVGSEMLSTKRRALVRLERESGKVVSIRLSDAMSPDRVTFYAYDDSGNDLEIDRLAKFKLTDELLVAFDEPGLDDVLAAESAQDGFADDGRGAGSDDGGMDNAQPLPRHAIETELSPEDLAMVREKQARGAPAQGPAQVPASAPGA
ncbi:MAG: Rne/Rng family ribonuclease, partial [Phycisphaerales bacterium]